MKAARKPETTPAALAQVTRAVVDAEAMKRKIRGVADPKPKDVDEQDTKRRQRRYIERGPVEPQEPEAPGK